MLNSIIHFISFYRQVDQLRNKIGKRDTPVPPHHWKHTLVCKAGDGVDLVQVNLTGG